MAQALSRCLRTSETQIRSHASTCGIYGGQSGTETVFSPRRLVASCPYHSTIVPTHLLSSCFFCRQYKRTKPVNLQIKQCYSRNREHWKEKDFQCGRGRVCCVSMDVQTFVSRFFYFHAVSRVEFVVVEIFHSTSCQCVVGLCMASRDTFSCRGRILRLETIRPGRLYVCLSVVTHYPMPHLL